MPSGYAFTTLLEAIGAVGSDHELTDQVGDLTDPVPVRTFVPPTCPYCPRAVQATFELALSNEEIVAEGVEATGFPVLSQSYRSASVPATIIGGNAAQRVLGAQPKQQFVEAIRSATTIAA